MDHDEAAIQEQRDKKAIKAKLSTETELDDIKWLMKTKRGRRIVWRQMTQAGVFQISFSTNAMQMAFNEGNRNSGNRLLTLVNLAAPDLYMTMVTENQ
jgi:hypothetical protein